MNTAAPSIGRWGIFGFFIKDERGQELDPNGIEVRERQQRHQEREQRSGQYYIQIISAEVEWSLRVEDCANTTTGTTATTATTATTSGDTSNRDSVSPTRLSETGNSSTPVVPPCPLRLSLCWRCSSAGRRQGCCSCSGARLREIRRKTGVWGSPAPKGGCDRNDGRHDRSGVPRGKAPEGFLGSARHSPRLVFSHSSRGGYPWGASVCQSSRSSSRHRSFCNSGLGPRGYANRDG